MKIITDIEQMQKYSIDKKRKNKVIGFVPTMGALHDGHFSLVKASLKKCDITIVSIYINPAQFGPNEDLANYPRTLEEDKKALIKLGVDVLFLPSDEIMYPSDYKTWVIVEKLTEKLCGKSRPVHFKGVTTVVTKLFNIVQCDYAFFGQKDYQQSVVIKQMVKDLNLPVNIIVCPIIREADGLAMSSRNKYLDNELRKQALVLNQALIEAQKLIKNGEKDSKNLIYAMEKILKTSKNAKIDYIEIIDPVTLDTLNSINNDCVIALAVYIGNTRLIDNCIIKIN